LGLASNPSIEYFVLFFLGDEEEMLSLRKLCAGVFCLNYEESRWKGLVTYRRLITELSPHIIHTHSFQPGFWGRLLKAGTNARIVSTIHSPYPYLRGAGILDRIKKHCEVIGMNSFNAQVICVSDAVRKYLLKNTHIREGLLRVIKNGVDLMPRKNEESAEVEHEIISNCSSKIITTIGRLSNEKGIDVLLVAFQQVLDTIHDATLVIIGNGPLEDKLKSLARELGIESRVRFLGFRRDIVPYLAASHLYACASRFEGLGMSLIEALAFGLPVVATRVGGIPEVIEDGKTGILVEPDNPVTMRNAIVSVLGNEKMAEHLRENGLKEVFEKFNIKNTIESYEKLYLKLASNEGMPL
jgi:glycosyltransferase involved in cell wall biosynthesis